MRRRLTSPIPNAALACVIWTALSHGAFATGADPAPPPDPAPCVAAIAANDDDKILAVCGALADNEKTPTADRVRALVARGRAFDRKDYPISSTRAANSGAKRATGRARCRISPPPSGSIRIIPRPRPITNRWRRSWSAWAP
jgi:hypothetical protein